MLADAQEDFKFHGNPSLLPGPQQRLFHDVACIPRVKNNLAHTSEEDPAQKHKQLVQREDPLRNHLFDQVRRILAKDELRGVVGDAVDHSARAVLVCDEMLHYIVAAGVVAYGGEVLHQRLDNTGVYIAFREEVSNNPTCMGVDAQMKEEVTLGQEIIEHSGNSLPADFHKLLENMISIHVEEAVQEVVTLFQKGEDQVCCGWAVRRDEGL